MKELNEWFAKQLDTVCKFRTSIIKLSFSDSLIKSIYQGPFRLVAEEGKSKCSWVSLDDISNIIVRGNLPS